jgi:hypothetical protein
MTARRRRWPLVLAIFIGLPLVGVGALMLGLRHPLPPATFGPDGDALAHAVEASVDAAAWTNTGAVRWTVMGRHHLWDRLRRLARVSWRKNRVLLDLTTLDGRAFHDGKEVDGEEKKPLLDRAYKLFVNDMFWLNPLTKLFDEGTERARLEVDGAPALLIRYASGGVTPGDRYLYLLGPDGRPRAWRVWVKILPVPGLEFSWEAWTRLSTGAWISTRHRIGPLEPVKIEDALAAHSVAELEPGPDPFAAIAH